MGENPSIHTVGASGLQAYEDPDPKGGLGVFLAGGTTVELVEARGGWARVDDDGRTGWVDGRSLTPPVAPQIPDRAAGSVAPTTISGGVLLALLGGIAVITGALIPWFSGGAEGNSFEVAVPFLFDKSSVERDPRLGYFLIGFGALALLTSFATGAGFVRRACGALATAAVVLYAIQLNSSFDSFGSSESAFDLLGAGPWVTAVGGVLVLFAPGAPRTRPMSRPPKPASTM